MSNRTYEIGLYIRYQEYPFRVVDQGIVALKGSIRRPFSVKEERGETLFKYFFKFIDESREKGDALRFYQGDVVEEIEGIREDGLLYFMYGPIQLIDLNSTSCL